MSIAYGAEAVERGCGFRQEGGVYAETGLSRYGRPLESFLIDPPVPLPSSLGLSPRGVKPLYRENELMGTRTLSLLDWIGEEHYPNICDFLEEGRRFGFSRRLPKIETFPYDQITPESRIIYVHRRAIPVWPHADKVERLGGWELCVSGRPTYQRWVEETRPVNMPKFPESLIPPGEDPWWCPKDAVCETDNHTPGFTRDLRQCCAVWWEDLTGGDPTPPEAFGLRETDRDVIRRMPSFTYRGIARPEGVELTCIPGFIASFPLTRLVVVKGAGAEEGLKLAGKAQIAVEEVDR